MSVPTNDERPMEQSPCNDAGSGQLHSYTRLKLGVAAQLRGLMETRQNHQAYASSQGVCLRHLAALIETVPATATRRFLLAEAARHFDETAEDMQSYAMKHAAMRRALMHAGENDASLRALIHLAGERNLCAP